MTRKNLLVGLGSVAVLLAAPARADWVRLTIVSAKIDASKLKKGAPRTSTGLSDLTCLASPGLRPIEAWCGDGARPTDVPAVDAWVRVEIPDHTVKTYPIPGTLAPEWNYSFVFDAGEIDDTGTTAFTLFDRVAGPDVKLGSKAVKTSELFKPGTHTLKPLLGSKSEITYKVETVSAEPRVYTVYVPADKQLADLARGGKILGPSGGGAAKEYALIPIAEGDTIDVSATGKVQPSSKKHPDIVSGPNGLHTQTTKVQWNQPGFRGCVECNHAALIAQIGSESFVVGEKKHLVATRGGLLAFGINDVKVEDNAGGYEVQVKVSRPGDQGSGLDPRVIQMVIDKHGDEIEACVTKEKDPYGKIQLLFSIAAEGIPLGVAVEDVSPNLKTAGECIQKAANQWRFPPSHGVTVARYPVSFSPG